MEIANLSKADLIKTATGVTPLEEDKSPTRIQRLALEILARPTQLSWTKGNKKKPWTIALSKEGILTFSKPMGKDLGTKDLSMILTTLSIACPKALEVIDLRGCQWLHDCLDELPLRKIPAIKVVLIEGDFLYVRDTGLSSETLEKEEFEHPERDAYAGGWVKWIRDTQVGDQTPGVWKNILGGSLWEKGIEYSRLGDIWLLAMRSILNGKVTEQWLDKSDPEKTLLLAGMLAALGKPDVFQPSALLQSAFRHYSDRFSLGQLAAWYQWTSSERIKRDVASRVVNRCVASCTVPPKLAKKLGLEEKPFSPLLQPMKKHLLQRPWPADPSVLKELFECFPDIKTIKLQVKDSNQNEESVKSLLKELNIWPQLTEYWICDPATNSEKPFTKKAGSE